MVEDCKLVAAADRRQLRSSDIATFVIPRTCTRLGDRTFPIDGPQLWNSLPSDSLPYPSSVPSGVKDVLTLFLVCYRNVRLTYFTCIRPKEIMVSGPIVHLGLFVPSFETFDLKKCISYR